LQQKVLSRTDCTIETAAMGIIMGDTRSSALDPRTAMLVSAGVVAMVIEDGPTASLGRAGKET
jgi:hypothetical protein